jgi:serine/threonine protein kinase
VSIETYGKYQLLKRLATGGMAQIYLARSQAAETAGRLLVVKRILPHLTENEDFVKMFIDEARIAARLNHANVVQIFDLGAEGDSFFIAMEYIHGEDLRRLCRHAELLGQPVPVPLVCRVLIEACAGLDYAHKRTDPTSGRPLGIVHRDVSPQNILVTFEGGVKVVDFGIAKAADQATITRSGVLKGKYSYMSPEQSNGQRVDCRSDIFALGVVLYELLTGSRLFKRASDIQTLTAVSECRVTPPSHVTTRVPADLDAIVLKALAKDPAERYQEAAHLQAALEGWLQVNRLPASPAHLSAYMKELYAERLAEEALTGEVLAGDSEPPPPPPTRPEPPLQPASRRSAPRPTPPTRPPVPDDDDEEAPTASLGSSPKTARVELEPEKPLRVTGQRRALEPSATEPEPEKPLRVTGQRRALEPSAPEPEPEKPPRLSGARRAVDPAPERASRGGLGAVPVPPRVEPAPSERASRGGLGAVPVPSERASRAGLGAVPPVPGSERASRGGLGAVPPPVPGSERASRGGLGAVPPVPPPVVEEDAPTVDSRSPRTTLTDVKMAVAAPPVPERPMSRVMPQAGDKGAEEPTRDERSLSRKGRHAQEEEDGPTLAMTEPQPSTWAAPPMASTDDEEEDAPTVSLGTSRPARKDTSTTTARVMLKEPRQASRPAWRVPVLALAAVVGLSLLAWRMVKRSDTAPAPAAAEVPAEARTPQVRFTADPWAEVTCGGKLLGQTPFETVELRVGTYDCTFFNPQLQQTRVRRIEVKPTGHNVFSEKFE